MNSDALIVVRPGQVETHGQIKGKSAINASLTFTPTLRKSWKRGMMMMIMENRIVQISVRSVKSLVITVEIIIANEYGLSSGYSFDSV